MFLFLTSSKSYSSSSRVRFYQYFPYLRSQGLEIVNASFFDDEYVKNLYSGHKASLFAAARAYLSRLFDLIYNTSCDLLWIEKEILPWFPALFETLFNKLKIPYVVDYDDAVFHRYDMHSSILIRNLLRNKIDRVMQSAALVIVGNEYLAQRARKAGASRVELLPSVVEVSRYKLKQPNNDSSFTIGWIGSPVTAPYLGIIRDAVESISRELPIRISLFGSGVTNPFPNVPTTFLPWDEEIELSIGQYFDVGVMPLNDGPFERGKCGYKLVQYMAAGIPIIASPVGMNQQIVEPGINGYLADSTDAWLMNLRILYHESSKRRAMGQAGRRKAEELYNLPVTAPKLLTLLSNA